MKLQSFTFTRVLPVVVVALLASCGGDNDDDFVPAQPPPTMPPPAAPPPAAPPPAYSEVYSATLNAASEVPPNPTAGTGTGSLSVDPVTRNMTASVTTTGVPGLMAHIHEGAAGVNGPIVFHLTESSAGSGVWSTTATLTEAQLAALRAGNMYFNVHTAVYPDGQVRGQIRP